MIPSALEFKKKANDRFPAGTSAVFVAYVVILVKEERIALIDLVELWSQGDNLSGGRWFIWLTPSVQSKEEMVTDVILEDTASF